MLYWQLIELPFVYHLKYRSRFRGLLILLSCNTQQRVNIWMSWIFCITTVANVILYLKYHVYRKLQQSHWILIFGWPCIIV